MWPGWKIVSVLQRNRSNRESAQFVFMCAVAALRIKAKQLK